MITVQDSVLNAVPANASITSSPIDIRQKAYMSFQSSATTGSAAGTFQLQVCNTPCIGAFINYAPPSYQWTNLGTPLTFSQTSTASSQLFAKIDVAYVAMRIVFTDTSDGTNTSTITTNVVALG